MPLIKSKSKRAFSENVKAEMSAGKPQNQALAIAYATKRKAKKGYAQGGMVEDDSETAIREEHEARMEEDGKFLSAEEHITPFHSIDYDDGETSDLFTEQPYDMEEGNEDQEQARAGVMERIMRRVRMRNMGR